MYDYVDACIFKTCPDSLSFVLTDYRFSSSLKLLGVMIVPIEVCTKYIHYCSVSSSL